MVVDAGKNSSCEAVDNLHHTVRICERQPALVTLVLVSVFVLQAVMMYCVKLSSGLIWLY